MDLRERQKTPNTHTHTPTCILYTNTHAQTDRNLSALKKDLGACTFRHTHTYTPQYFSGSVLRGLRVGTMLLPRGLLSIAVLYNTDQTYLLIIQGDRCLAVFDYSVVSTAVISDCSVGTFYTFYLGSIVFIVSLLLHCLSS